MSASRTNQSLYFAKQALNDALESEGQQDVRRHQEAALFHIYASFGAFCQELVFQYRLPPFRSVAELLGREGLPQELKELSLLMAQSESWLAALLNQFQRVLTMPLDDSQKNSDLIVSQSDFGVLYRNYLIELENLIQRMREQYLEC